MHTLRQGKTLQGGKYTIVHELGSGSFGITYLAQMQVTVSGALGSMQHKFNVAIKEFFMREMNTRREGSAVVEGTNSELVRNYRRKFRTEAENLSRMKHPGIVKVLDIFDENDTTYYVMAYIEGQSLDGYVHQKGGIPTDEALRIIRQVAEAVGYMHRHKMLHLDLKPKNVMMDSAGRAYLIDFGLSKQYTDDGQPESSTTLGLGTPGYAPMEQVSYKQDGSFPATLDIYALGATLYKMLTGQTPPDSHVVFNDGFDRKPMSVHGVPTWLQDAVEKTMSPGKRQRPQTVEEFMALIGGTVRDLVDDIVEKPVRKPTPDDEVTVIEKAKNKWPSEKCHPQMVDLGLPSGTKWASCNVGASAPEQSGDYFRWGETEPYFEWGKKATFLSNLGNLLIGKNIAGTKYDAATANWGRPWRLPTEEQMKELLNNCKYEWTTQNGVKGGKVTGPNGNAIFLPASGFRSGSRGRINRVGDSGGYWSASHYGVNGYQLHFYSGGWNWDYFCWDQGYPVRPVAE